MGSSSARVNKHTMQQTGRQIWAPTAWSIEFVVESEAASAESAEPVGEALDVVRTGVDDEPGPERGDRRQ